MYLEKIAIEKKLANKLFVQTFTRLNVRIFALDSNVFYNFAIAFNLYIKAELEEENR